MALTGASAALAAGPGGVEATSPSAVKPPVHKIHTFPVTSRSQNLAYAGPVYQRTATGAVIPYQPPASGLPALPAAPVLTAAVATTGGIGPASGGPVPVAVPKPKGPVARPELLVPGTTAHYVDGIAAAPMAAPLAVQEIIWAGNELIGLPYIFGGGHASFISPGYDCSGTVSYALHGGGVLASTEDSSELMGWGSHGLGRWVSIFSNPEHAYMTVAGLRLDTSAADDPSNQQGPRWRPLRPGNPGFTARHPTGL
jgi:cell wall-associated NlpC family hydrolase